MQRYLEIEHLLKLSSAVYRVTELFPETEPLKFQIRESANKILADLLLNQPITGGVGRIGYPQVSGERSDLADLLLNKTDESNSRQISEIFGLFDLVREKNWVDPRNFLVLKQEYDKIRQSAVIGENSGKTVENSFSHNGKNGRNGNGQNGHRQEKILEVMNNGMVKIGDLIKMFPGINRRTVLRDLDKLCQAGSAVRNGNGRGAHYIKNGHNHDMS